MLRMVSLACKRMIWKGNMMRLELIQNVLYENLKDAKHVEWREIGSKYYHGLRTARLAIHLRELIFPNMTEQDEIITVAAWFHDILNNGTANNHPERGAELTRELLRELASPEELDEIAYLIRLHDTKTDSGVGFIPDYPDTLKLLQDADYLDHFGSIWLWDTIRHSVTAGENFHELADKVSGWRDEDLCRYLVYPESKRIACERLAFMKSVTARVKVEAEGDIFGMAELFGGNGI